MNRKARRSGAQPPAGNPPGGDKQLSALIAKGLELHRGGDLAGAQAYYLAARELGPSDGRAQHYLGVVALQSGQAQAAADLISESLTLRPRDAEAWSNLGIAQKILGQFDAAADAWQRTLTLAPSSADALSNLANLRHEEGDMAGAALLYRKALSYAPRHAHAHNNYATTLQALGRSQEAISHLRKALAIDPTYLEARKNLGLFLLHAGELPEGWDAYRARLAANPDEGGARQQPVPTWNGAQLDGRRLLVWREQGVGDELIFASMYRDLLHLNGPVTIESDPRLVSLFARSFPGANVRADTRALPPEQAFQEIDLAIPAGDLGAIFRPSLSAFPADRAYLTPDPQAVANWRQRLATLGSGRKIGLCWRGRVKSDDRDDFYTKLTDWISLLQAHNIITVSLQYGNADGEIAACLASHGVAPHVFHDLDLMNGFDQVAALDAALDHVISVDTAAAPLAAAVGTPVSWMTTTATWAMLGTGRQPWHPGAIVHAKQPGTDWAPHIQAAVAEACGNGKSAG